jgi:dTDP-4-amino-4,6-dideoxygalactose transaminase
MIYVTQPSLAPLEEFTEILRGVWERGILTHNGPLVQQLERELCSKLKISNCVAVSNGTIAIQMAIKALGLSHSGGEIITTPFTWIASISAIQWEGCHPVFVDIDPDTFNLDPAGIEAAITDRTVAIMPVYVFGNPCDCDAIQAIADRCGIKVIYDAAHAVGATLNGRSLLEYGDISATSLHATKLINTAEGGACITRNTDLHEKLKRIRFFGHNDAKDIVEEGFNGKMTEVHAALGLANLKYFDEVLADRKRKYLLYKELLADVPGLSFQSLTLGEANYSYFPVLFPDESACVAAEKLLQTHCVIPRRYFYPAVDSYAICCPHDSKKRTGNSEGIMADGESAIRYSQSAIRHSPFATNVASRILCLPLYWKLEENEIHRIARLLLK